MKQDLRMLFSKLLTNTERNSDFSRTGTDFLVMTFVKDLQPLFQFVSENVNSKDRQRDVLATLQ